MFRSTRTGKLLPLSLSVLLVTAIGTTGQREKPASKGQDPATTTPRESVPLVIERGSDSKESSHAIVPSDPLVKLLRSFGVPMDQDPKANTQRHDSARVEDSVTTDAANSSFEYADPFEFIFCGRNGISVEDFTALTGSRETTATTSKPVAKSREEVAPVVHRTASKPAKVFRQ